jgi:predicted transposase/invertase (TIGR01784 family)
VFKHFFSADLKVTSSFISAILFPDDSNEIEVIEILSPEMISPFPEGKRTYLDFKARDKKGTIYQIELQVSKELSYVKRSLYYATNLISHSLKAGESYLKIPQVIQINILDYILFENSDQFVSSYQLREKESRNILTDDFQMIYLELPKFRKNRFEDLSTKEDYWIYLLKNSSNLTEDEKMQVMNKLPDIKKSLYVLELYASDPEKRRMAEERLRNDENYAYELAAHYEDGEAKGIEKGIQKGETKKALETARKMRIKGYSDPEISEITGLGDEDLKGI